METNIILLVYFQKGEKVSKGQNFVTFIGQAGSKQLVNQHVWPNSFRFVCFESGPLKCAHKCRQVGQLSSTISLERLEHLLIQVQVLDFYL